jgi:hypothetical protein
MNNIPKALKADMAADPFYRQCCITGALATNTKVEWHHNFIFAGRQVQEKWCILPLRKDIHDDIVSYKERCDWIMYNRADDETLRRYSKSKDLIRERDRLNKKYGTPKYKTPLAQ